MTKEELNLESELFLDNGCLVWTFPKCVLPQQPVDLYFKALRSGVFKIASKNVCSYDYYYRFDIDIDSYLLENR